MANGNARLFVNTRQRNLVVARGHTMPSDLKYVSGGCGIRLRVPAPVFAESGISVPISRGSPPLFING